MRKKTEEEIALEGLSKDLSLSEVSAHEEIRAYILLVKDMDIKDRCTLGFFKIHGHKFPLLAKVALRLLQYVAAAHPATLRDYSRVPA